MKKFVVTLTVQALLAVATVHGTFLPRGATSSSSITTTTNSYPPTAVTATATTNDSVVSVTNIVGLPRGGEASSASTFITRVSNKAKEVNRKITARKQTPGSKVMVSSLMLLLGGFLCDKGMNLIPVLYPTQSTFLFNTNNLFGHKSAKELCEAGKSILYAYPLSVSESISDQSGIASVILNTFGTLAAILFLAGRLGQPSVFPMEASHAGCLFNFVRLICPITILYFVPNIRTLGLNGGVTNPGDTIELATHTLSAANSWVLCPLCEMISSVIDLAKFYHQNPRGDKFIPSDADVEENPKVWVGTLYKSLWVGFTIARGMLSLAMLIFLVKYFQFGEIYDVAHDCDALNNIRGASQEWIMSALVGSLYILLAISQLIESSGRRLSSLLYLVPIIVFFSKRVGMNIVHLLWTFDMKKNYLKIVEMPGGVPSAFMLGVMNSYKEWEGDWKSCTIALKDLDNVPKNCFAKDYYTKS